jgi:uncharacterized membrane protein YgdD (TMEM256/DUF423 family)
MEKNSTLNLKNITISATDYKILATASFFLFLAVAFGAFGAHGLEGKISQKALATFKTGNFYHFIQALSLVLLIFTSQKKKLLKNLNLLGIFLFSGNCYLYALTEVKIFALLVPFGGVSFLIFWFLLFRNFSKSFKESSR